MTHRTTSSPHISLSYRLCEHRKQSYKNLAVCAELNELVKFFASLNNSEYLNLSVSYEGQTITTCTSSSTTPRLHLLHSLLSLSILGFVNLPRWISTQFCDAFSHCSILSLEIWLGIKKKQFEKMLHLTCYIFCESLVPILLWYFNDPGNSLYRV
jgi:hypothetical protein